MTYRKDDKKDDLIKLIVKTTSTEENPIDIMQKKLDMIEIEREKCMIRKGMVKEVIGRIERQNDSILELVNKEENSMGKMQKKLDMIEIGREKGMIRKEIEKAKIERQNNSLVELVNKE